MPFKVNIIESERGWGQKVDDRVYFMDGEAAYAYVKEFNSKNTEKIVPDLYWYAQEPVYIESLPENTKVYDAD